jgi:hypothetical protein
MIAMVVSLDSVQTEQKHRPSGILQKHKRQIPLFVKKFPFIYNDDSNSFIFFGKLFGVGNTDSIKSRNFR